MGCPESGACRHRLIETGTLIPSFLSRLGRARHSDATVVDCAGWGKTQPWVQCEATPLGYGVPSLPPPDPVSTNPILASSIPSNMVKSDGRIGQGHSHAPFRIRARQRTQRLRLDGERCVIWRHVSRPHPCPLCTSGTSATGHGKAAAAPRADEGETSIENGRPPPSFGVRPFRNGGAMLSTMS